MNVNSVTAQNIASMETTVSGKGSPKLTSRERFAVKWASEALKEYGHDHTALELDKLLERQRSY